MPISCMFNQFWCTLQWYGYPTLRKCDIERLEAVQRRAARFVMFDYNRTSSVTVMLQNLKTVHAHTIDNFCNLLRFFIDN